MTCTCGTCPTKMFERSLIKHCTPTLLGIKPANMFVHRQAGSASSGTGAAGCGCGRFSDLLHAFRGRLAPMGVRIEVLAQRKTGHLVYVYRPKLVKRDLSDGRVRDYLEDMGYRVDDLGSCMELLHQRICGTDLASLVRGTCAFPHEIGFFLGYPYDDVVGFIENEGRDSLCTGCWKVYSKEQDARDCFCRYKESTRQCLELHDQGLTLEQLIGGAA